MTPNQGVNHETFRFGKRWRVIADHKLVEMRRDCPQQRTFQKPERRTANHTFYICQPADRNAGTIWFVRGTKDDEIGVAHDIGLVFIDEGNRAYLSVTGRAFVTRDTARTQEIWRKTDDIWLPGGPENPNVRALRIEPITAELWDGPSSAAVTAFEFAKKR